MDDSSGTKDELQREIKELRTRIAELEQAVAVDRGQELPYHRLFESAKDGIVLVCPDTGKIIDVNQAFLALSGCSRETLMNMRFWEDGPLKNTDVGPIIFTELRNQDYIYYDDLPFEANDGKRISVELTCSIHSLESRRIVQCAVRDITRRKTIEEDLWRAESRFRTLFKEAAMGIAICDRENHIVEINHRFESMLGYGEKELLGRPCSEFIHQEDAYRDAALYHELLEKKRDSYQMAVRFIRKDGGLVWGLLAVSLIQAMRGMPHSAMRMIEDITKRKQAEELIIRARDFYLSLIDELPNPIRRSDADATCDYFNKAWLAFTGRTMGQEIGDAWLQGVHPEDRDRLRELQASSFKTRSPYVTEYRLRYYNEDYHWIVEFGSPFNDLDGSFGGYIGSCYDVQDRKTYEEMLQAMVTTDELTGLLNRRGFFTRAQEQLKAADGNKQGLLLFFADLDELKKINDTSGHPEGDLALVEAASVLKEVFSASELIGRLGGDEFAVLMPAKPGESNESAAILTRLRETLKRRNAQPGRRYALSISMGVKAYDPRKPCSLDELITQADTLMYREKKLKYRTRRSHS